MAKNDELSEAFAKIRTGLRRTLAKGALLENERMAEMHRRLLDLDPGQLVQKPLCETRCVVVDTETTGLNAYAGDEICSISLLEMVGLKLTGREFNSLVNPGREIPETTTEIHGLSDDHVRHAPVIEEIMLEIADFIGDAVLIGHHVGFDIRFLNKTLESELMCSLRNPWLDTMLLYLMDTGRVGHYSLEEVAGHAGVAVLDRHTARGDAMTAAQVFEVLVDRLGGFDAPLQKLIDRQYELGQF